ncbi:MAG: NUDIX hydrolase [Anaerolineae bacterium]|nr:NUDIX hydrolase [Anaerolineae bacterium]
MDDTIRVRACLAVTDDRCGRILLVPHYNTDAGPVQWCIPGGRVHFGERACDAALREFLEETGLTAEITGLLDVSEVIKPAQPWHSVTITFAGRVLGGELAAEADHPHGVKLPRWLSRHDLASMPCHPAQTIDKALNTRT